MRSGPSHGQDTERDGNVLDASAVDPQFAYLFASLITDFSVATREMALQCTSIREVLNYQSPPRRSGRRRPFGSVDGE